MDFIYKGIVRKYTLIGSPKLGFTKSRITLEIQKKATRKENKLTLNSFILVPPKN